METAQLHASELRRSLEGLAALNQKEQTAVESQRTGSSPDAVQRKQEMRSNHARETERMIAEVEERGYD